MEENNNGIPINEDQHTNGQENGRHDEEKVVELSPLGGMYQSWFLDYASYVILERAVPAVEDGLKPVQRRILHAMREMDDGRFHKVANIIGQTMQYHPHGDAAIGDALVNLGQKELLIETQGNWGDIRTGDSAAAPRYIEARLSPFAKEVAFNPQTTEWQLSYDGRKKEPVHLPMKFPLVLAQGVEGIAVGLSTKIMPHNFVELCKGAINILKDKKVELFPDFPTGGHMDASNYNGGKRGGRIKVRAKIEIKDKETLLITEIPYGTTTSSIIDSIIKANDSGKIKIKKVIDNTAEHVEIEVQLAKKTSPEITMDALYAFTDCEVSISPNACVIVNDKPQFLTVDEILQISTKDTKELLKRELEIRLQDLEDKWHFSSLEKIFIENRIYREIEEEETWEGVLDAIWDGLQPFVKLLKREIEDEDLVRLTEIKIKRISKFDAFKADEQINQLEEQIAEAKHHLEHLNDYAIEYFQNLLKKYGKGRERKTTIREFVDIEANVVAQANEKLYVNRKEGFIGTALKRDEFVCECSDIDDIIVIKRDGTLVVTRVDEKKFVGKDILHVDVWKRDERMVYNLAYVDGKMGVTYGKRFNVTAITRDREYNLTRGSKNSRLTYFSANPNSEAEVVEVQLTQNSKARKKKFDYDFAELEVRSRSVVGNIITKHPVRKITLKEKGTSTLGARPVFYDQITGRLNEEERGQHIGDFEADEPILIIYNDGSYELSPLDLVKRYVPEKVVQIRKWDPEQVVTAIHYDAGSKQYYVKRFQIETSSFDKPFSFIEEGRSSKLEFVTLEEEPVVKVVLGKKKKDALEEVLDLADFAPVMGWRAKGKKLGPYLLETELVEKEDLVTEEEEEESNGSSSAPTPEKPKAKPEQKKTEPTSKTAEETASKKDSSSGKGGAGQMGLF